jgi:non-ribosomal peptide synthetase component F
MSRFGRGPAINRRLVAWAAPDGDLEFLGRLDRQVKAAKAVAMI